VKTALRPALGARAAIVLDAATGHTVWALDAHRRLPIASTTKIMTAHLVLQRRPLGALVRISWTVPRVPLIREGLRVGERVPTWKLLYGMLLYSGNDDALALAIATSGSRPAFVKLMNREAARLRLLDTRFTTPSGVIDDGNYSTAFDLAALTRVAMRDPRFREIVRTRIKRVGWSPPTRSKVYVNKNRLLTLYPSAIGVKTGWTTRAGRCLVGAATRRGRTLIAVVLHSDRPYNDAARLLNLGFRTLD
jgi:D-alanyl-D-alanine carboxypeptidase